MASRMMSVVLKSFTLFFFINCVSTNVDFFLLCPQTTNSILGNFTEHNEFLFWAWSRLHITFLEKVIAYYVSVHN